VTDFLGSPATGGFLKAATDTMDGLLDPISGVLPTAVSSISNQITNTDNLIARNQDRVDQLRENLTAQMAAADALIATMEQQVNYFTAMLSAMQINQNSLNR